MTSSVRTAQLTVAEAVSKSLAGAFMKALAGILLFLLLADWAMAVADYIRNGDSSFRF